MELENERMKLDQRAEMERVLFFQRAWIEKVKFGQRAGIEGVKFDQGPRLSSNSKPFAHKTDVYSSQSPSSTNYSTQGFPTGEINMFRVYFSSKPISQ